MRRVFFVLLQHSIKNQAARFSVGKVIRRSRMQAKAQKREKKKRNKPEN